MSALIETARSLQQLLVEAGDENPPELAFTAECIKDRIEKEPENFLNRVMRTFEVRVERPAYFYQKFLQENKARIAELFLAGADL